MKWSFKSLSISNKVAAVFLVLLFMMGIGGSVGLYNGSQIEKVTERLYMDSFKREAALSQIEKDLLSHRQQLFLHTVVNEHSSKSYIKGSLVEHNKRIDRRISEYKSFGVADNEQFLRELTYSLSEYRTTEARVVSLSNENERARAITLMRGGGEIKFAAVMTALKRLINDESAKAYSDYQTIRKFAGIIIIVTLIFTVLAIFVAGGLWFALTRSIVAPLRAIAESARSIAKGDFKERVPVATDDELGRLAGEFNKMAEQLEDSYSTLEAKVIDRTVELNRINVELKESKREVEDANVELMSANKMKSQFLANVSHEFRTPMNSIIGFSDLLREKACGELNEKQLKYLDYIRSSSGNLLNLINNILELSRIEVGALVLEPEDFSLTEVLGEVLGTVKPMAHNRGIAVSTKKAPASPVIRADKTKFKQILYNILSNAIKFNKDGGTVDVGWEIKDEPSGMRMERYLTISVTDTGIGIGEDDAKRIFKEFEQIDQSSTREYEGSGLGLSLAERLVKLHSGYIWFESKPGGAEGEGEGGTVFYIKLPQGTEQIDLPKPEPRSSAVARESEELTVLIACESADLNELLSIYLAGTPYAIVTAEDGDELIHMTNAHLPFAVIMGITLPKRDGWEVMKEFKANEATADIPIILLSSDDNKEMGFSLGAAAYLEKPVARVRVLDLLSRLASGGDSNEAIRA
ncbi:MAG: ATP-binding protein [Thermodesulfobacteriota bacterium]